MNGVMGEKKSFSNSIPPEVLEQFYSFAKDHKTNKQLAIEAAFKFIQAVPAELQRIAIRGDRVEIDEWFRVREAAWAEQSVRQSVQKQDQERQTKPPAGRQPKSGGKRG